MPLDFRQGYVELNIQFLWSTHLSASQNCLNHSTHWDQVFQREIVALRTASRVDTVTLDGEMRRLKAGIVEFLFPVSFQFWQQPVSPSLSGFCMLSWLRCALVLHRSSNARSMQHGTISCCLSTESPARTIWWKPCQQQFSQCMNHWGAMHKKIGWFIAWQCTLHHSWHRVYRGCQSGGRADCTVIDCTQEKDM